MSAETSPTPLTYRDAGVDIDAGNAVVERIKPLVKRTFRPEVMGGLESVSDCARMYTS